MFSCHQMSGLHRQCGLGAGPSHLPWRSSHHRSRYNTGPRQEIGRPSALQSPPPPISVFQCLWYKVKVGTRVEPWLKTLDCPLCGARETVFHALHNCAFYARINHFMVCCFSEWRILRTTGRWVHFFVMHSLSTFPGLVLSAARKAHWVVRCAALPCASPDFNTLVTKWLGQLRSLLFWDPLKALRPAIEKFFNSLMHYSQEGAFPPSTLSGVCGPSAPAVTRLPRNQRSKNATRERQPLRNKSFQFRKYIYLKFMQ